MKKCMKKYGYTKTETIIFMLAFASIVVSLIGYIIHWSTKSADTFANTLIIIGSAAFLILSIISLALACKRYMRLRSVSSKAGEKEYSDNIVNTKPSLTDNTSSI